MKPRTKKRYYKTYAVIIRDSQGTFPEYCRAVFPYAAAEKCRLLASHLGGTVVTVIQTDKSAI